MVKNGGKLWLYILFYFFFVVGHGEQRGTEIPPETERTNNPQHEAEKGGRIALLVIREKDIERRERRGKGGERKKRRGEKVVGKAEASQKKKKKKVGGGGLAV